MHFAPEKVVYFFLARLSGFHEFARLLDRNIVHGQTNIAKLPMLSVFSIECGKVEKKRPKKKQRILLLQNECGMFLIGQKQLKKLVEIYDKCDKYSILLSILGFLT